MKNERDESPVLIDTLMKISKMQWSPNGTVLAFAGTQVRASLCYYIKAQAWSRCSWMSKSETETSSNSTMPSASTCALFELVIPMPSFFFNPLWS